jgi:hypothetical protein
MSMFRPRIFGAVNDVCIDIDCRNIDLYWEVQAETYASYPEAGPAAMNDPPDEWWFRPNTLTPPHRDVTVEE